MRVNTASRQVRAMVALALVSMALRSVPARAQTPPAAQYQCVNNLISCYYWAAAQGGFWTMWASGFDCELQVIACARQAIIGR